ncbi:MAG: methionyl-tRNA formyltransferase [Rhodospirillaceae bacterium]
MRLIVMGQQAFGKSALEAILDKGDDEVVAVYCAPDKDGRVDPIKELAQERRLPVRQPDNFKSPDVLNEMKAFKADLCVMAYVIIFVPEAARNIPTHGSICFHPSLLPLHRGPSSINWPIIWGATKTGISYFWPDDGLDEGEILLQKEIEIGPDDTLGSVYFDKAFPMGIAATLEAIDLVRAGNPPKVPQDDSKATYEGWCNKKAAEIDWSCSVGEVYNLIRGCNPQPGAWTTLNGETLQIFECQKVDDGAFGRVGQVAAVDDDGILVTAGRGAIRVQRVRYADGKKVTAKAFADEVGLEAGAKLGT